jgi:hypothetical protein
MIIGLRSLRNLRYLRLDGCHQLDEVQLPHPRVRVTGAPAHLVRRI